MRAQDPKVGRTLAAVIGLAALLAVMVAPAAASASANRAIAGPVPTSIVLKSSRPEAHYGDPGQITATVKALKSGVGVPTGNVEFMVDGLSLSTAALSNGKATLPLAELYPSFGVGPHTIVASYLPEGSFEASTSAPITQSLIGRTSEAVSTLTLNEKGYPVFSPNTFSLRYQDPFSCNVAIHNETPYAYQLLYGTPGNWKALRSVIPSGGVGGVGVGLEHFTGYFTVRGAANFVRIGCN